MTRASHSVTRVGALALVAAAVVSAALAQGSWLEGVRGLDADGRTRDALSRLEAEPERLAGNVEARLLRGVLLAKLGRTAEARELYQQLIRERPDLPEAYNNLAVMHAAAGDYDAAIEILKQGLATHPSYRTTYDNLTKVYGKLAGEAYSKALGDERIDAEPLRLALINGLARAAPSDGAAGAAAAERVAERAPGDRAQPVAAAPAPRPADPAPPAQPAPPDAGEIERAVWRAVQSWAEAWADQEADAYLSFYDRSFVPPGGSRAAWEALRRRRLEAPEFIEISLALLEVEQPAPDRAIARFVQSYASDRYRDTVTKVLELVSTDDGWLIVGERVEVESDG